MILTNNILTLKIYEFFFIIILKNNVFFPLKRYSEFPRNADSDGLEECEEQYKNKTGRRVGGSART